MTVTSDLTLDNFTERTGRRFRVSREQKERIEAGTLTREQAFQEFLSNGGADRATQESSNIPAEVYLRQDLTLSTFGDITEEMTGQRRRFRVSSDQAERIKAGTLTREQAFVETIERIRQENVS